MKIKLIILVLLISLLSACTTIPQESVNLSSEVGIGLKKQHQFQVELVNLYFDIKRKELDETMVKELDEYYNILAPTGEIKLKKAQFIDVVADAEDFNTKYNAAKKELEKAKMLIIKKLDENYLALNQANASITELLQSSVDVKKAKPEAPQTISKTTAGKIDIDIDKALAEVDKFTFKGGEEAEKATMLDDLLRKIFGENQDKEDGI